MKLKQNPFIYLLLVIVLITTACSTQKNTRASRAYHNLTARYNVYFNGNESFKQGQQKVVKNNVNDYTRVLPVFEYSNAANTHPVAAEMDRAIEKGTILIAKHSITKKPKKKGSEGDEYYKAFYNQKEFNKWVDDAYLLIGKAHFYKHDFDMAIRTFDHILRDFPNSAIRFETYLWKAAAYAEKGDFVNAKLSLENYDAGGNPPKSLYPQYMAIYADLLLKQKLYEASIPYLKGAYNNSRQKAKKIRYAYIMAQVYELSGRYSEAQNMFTEVIKLKPPFEMAINASINKSSLVLPDLSNVEQIKREIDKLLRSKKNTLYRDRIYYALANAYHIEGDNNQALKNLKLSTQTSAGNEKQKAVSFIKMGDIYYDIPSYKPAYLSYDSALLYLPKTDDLYNSISVKHTSLQELVNHIDIKEREDSLLRLANLSEFDRNAAIDKMIESIKAKIKEDEEKQAISNYSDPYFMQNSYQNTTQQQGGKWYFYNLTSVSQGKVEFERKWGKRKLEDNWRRANKAAVIQTEDGPTYEPPINNNIANQTPNNTNENNQAINNVLGELPKIPTREQLLADIPLSAEKQAESKERIENALLSMAIVYRDRFVDYDLAIGAFEELLTRFPATSKKEEALIELYRTYQQKGDTKGMAAIKQQLTNGFPNSKFTAYLNDPLFVQKVEELRARESAEYESTYTNYINGFHLLVIEKANLIELNQPENQYRAKYRLLKALSYAREAQTDEFKTELDRIVALFPQTEEAELATAFLNELAKGRVPVKSVVRQSQSGTLPAGQISQVQPEQAAGQFTVDAKAPHSIAIVIPETTDLKRLRFNVADFNFENYLVRDFELALITLPDNSRILEVKGFENKTEAMEYFYRIRQYPEVFMVEGLTKPTITSVSADNLKFIVSSGDLKGYYPFFIQIYLRGQNTFVQMSATELQDAMGNLAPEEINLKTLEEKTKAAETVEKPEGFYPDEGPHWFMLTYNSLGVNHNRLQTIFTGFVRNNLTGSNFSVEIVDIKPQLKALLVKGFSDESSARGFIELVQKNAFTTNEVRQKTPQQFVITPGNFDYLVKTGDIELFKQFYNNK